MRDRKELHDELLRQMPEGAKHETCALCTAPEKPEGGSVSGRTYTEAELHAAVEEAIAPLAAQLAQFQAAQQESEIEAQVTAIKAEAEAVIEDLQAKLDAAVLGEQRAVQEYEAFKAELEELADAQAREIEVASRREARLARVREVASFPDEYLEANADRFAAMSDEDFEDRCAEWASLSAKQESPGIPKHTALAASRESAPKTDGMQALREVMGLRFSGVDPRSI